MADMNDVVDVLVEIRDILEDIKLQNDISMKIMVNRNNNNFDHDEKLLKYKLKLMQESREEEDE